MRVLCFFVLLIASKSIIAQNQQQPIPVIYLKDKNGMDLLGRSAYVEQKDYLLYKEYVKGKLVTQNDQVIEGFKYKLDLKTSILYYTTENGEEMEVVTPNKRVEFELADGKKRVFQKGYSGTGELQKNNYVEVLVEGKATLLLLHGFIEVEKMEYGVGMKKQTDKLFYYYGVVENKVIQIQKADDLVALFEGKKNEVTSYISSEKIKSKKQTDLEKLFTWYNK